MKILMTFLDRFNNLFSKIAETIVIISIVSQTILVFSTVIFRYFIQRPITWGDEVAALLLVFITFFGSYLALSKNRLARIELFIVLFKDNWKKLAYLISEILTLSMLMIVLYYGYRLFITPTSLRQRTPGIFIPLWIFYGMIPLTFFAGIMRTFSKMVRIITGEKEEIRW